MTSESDSEVSQEQFEEDSDVSDDNESGDDMEQGSDAAASDDGSDEEDEDASDVVPDEEDEDASDDESDDDDDESDESDEDDPEEDVKPVKKPKDEKTAIQIAQDKVRAKYAERKGKTLFLRFPKTLKTDIDALEAEIKALNPRVIKVHRPRQPSARFCLVDFVSTEDRQKAFKELSKIDVDGKRLHVAIPHTDGDAFVDNICKKRQKAIKDKVARKKLAKSVEAANKADKTFTSTIQVKNIPTSASISEVKKLFPNAVDFKLTYATSADGTNSAIVSMPTPKDATQMQKKKLNIGDNKLIVSYVFSKGKNKKKKLKRLAEKMSRGEDSTDDETNSSDNKKKKKLKKSSQQESDEEAGPAVTKKSKKTIKAEASSKKNMKIKGKPAPIASRPPKKYIKNREEADVPVAKKIKKENKSEPSEKPAKFKKHAEKKHSDADSSGSPQKSRKPAGGKFIRQNHEKSSSEPPRQFRRPAGGKFIRQNREMYFSGPPRQFRNPTGPLIYNPNYMPQPWGPPPKYINPNYMPQLWGPPPFWRPAEVKFMKQYRDKDFSGPPRKFPKPPGQFKYINPNYKSKHGKINKMSEGKELAKQAGIKKKGDKTES